MTKTRAQVNAEIEVLVKIVEDRETFPELDESLRQKIIKEIRDKNITMAFGLARHANQPTIAQIFEQRGINLQDPELSKRLLEAAWKGEKEEVEIILGFEVDINIREEGSVLIYGATPLILSVINGHAEIVEMLIRAGADVNRRALYHGGTALIYCCVQGHVEIARLLLQVPEIDINAMEIANSMTPLSWAIGRSIPILDLLLEKKPDLTLLTSKSLFKALTDSWISKVPLEESVNRLISYSLSLENLSSFYHLMKISINDFLPSKIAEIVAAVLPTNDPLIDETISKHKLNTPEASKTIAGLRDLNNKLTTQSLLRGNIHPVTTARIITSAYAFEQLRVKKLEQLTEQDTLINEYTMEENAWNWCQLSIEQRNLLSEVLEEGKAEYPSEEKQNPPSASPHRANIERLRDVLLIDGSREKSYMQGGANR